MENLHWNEHIPAEYFSFPEECHFPGWNIFMTGKNEVIRT